MGDETAVTLLREAFAISREDIECHGKGGGIVAVAELAVLRHRDALRNVAMAAEIRLQARYREELALQAERTLAALRGVGVGVLTGEVV